MLFVHGSSAKVPGVHRLVFGITQWCNGELQALQGVPAFLLPSHSLQRHSPQHRVAKGGVPRPAWGVNLLSIPALSHRAGKDYSHAASSNQGWQSGVQMRRQRLGEGQRLIQIPLQKQERAGLKRGVILLRTRSLILRGAARSAL
jgi:hypothetical protein